MQGLKKAIADGKVKGVQIFDTPELLDAIQKSNIKPELKKNLTSFCLYDDEVLIMGTVPKEYVQILK